MEDQSRRKRYYPEEENVPLSEAILEAARAHDNASLSIDEFSLYDHINPQSLDTLFKDTAGADIYIEIDLTDTTVTLWSDGGIDIQVTD